MVQQSADALVGGQAVPACHVDALHPLGSGEVLERVDSYRTNPLSARSQRHPSTQRSDVHSYQAPDDAAATAVATTAALRILCAAGIPAAADAARWLTERVAASGRPLYPAGVVSVGGTLSPVLEAALRCSREAQIMPVYRLRHRTAARSTVPTATFPPSPSPAHSSGSTHDRQEVPRLLLGP